MSRRLVLALSWGAVIAAGILLTLYIRALVNP